MNVHLVIPSGPRFFMESLKVPFLGEFIHRILSRSKDSYTELMLCLVGFHELVQLNKVKLSDKDIKLLVKIKRVLAVLNSISSQSQDENISQIKESVLYSIDTIDKILEIFEQQRNYNQLKKDLFTASSASILSNFNKYKESVYEN